jgi:hypothetical protein
MQVCRDSRVDWPGGLALEAFVIPLDPIANACAVRLRQQDGAQKGDRDGQRRSRHLMQQVTGRRSGEQAYAEL